MRQELNLIDARLLPVAARPSALTLLALLVSASIAVLGHYGWERARFNAALTLPAVEQAALPDEATPDATLEALRRQVERDELLRDGLARASDLPTDSAKLLRQVAAALPATLWLTEVELSGRTGLRIAGGTLDVTALATYAEGLGRIAGLKGRALQALAVEPQKPQTNADSELGAADALPPHHRFVLANGDAQVSNHNTP